MQVCKCVTASKSARSLRVPCILWHSSRDHRCHCASRSADLQIRSCSSLLQARCPSLGTEAAGAPGRSLLDCPMVQRTQRSRFPHACPEILATENLNRNDAHLWGLRQPDRQAARCLTAHWLSAHVTRDVTFSQQSFSPPCQTTGQHQGCKPTSGD